MRFLYSYNIRFMLPKNLFDIVYDEEKNETRITIRPTKNVKLNNVLDYMTYLMHYAIEYEFPKIVIENKTFSWEGLPERYISNDLPTKKGDYFKFECEGNKKVEGFKVAVSSAKVSFEDFFESLDEMDAPLNQIYVFKEGSGRAYPLIETELTPEPKSPLKL